MLHMPSARLLAQPTYTCTQSSFHRAKLSRPVAFYLARFYMSIFSSAGLSIDELLSRRDLGEWDHFGKMLSFPGPFTLLHRHTTNTFCVNYT